MRPGKRARVGTRIQLLAKTGGRTGIQGEVVEFNDEGHRRVRFSGADNIFKELRAGWVPCHLH